MKRQTSDLCNLLLSIAGPPCGGSDDVSKLAAAEREANSLRQKTSLWWYADDTEDFTATAVERLAEQIRGNDRTAAEQVRKGMTVEQDDALIAYMSSHQEAAYYVGLARGWQAAQMIGGAR